MNQNQTENLLARWSFPEKDGAVTYDEITKVEDQVHYVFHQAAFQPNKTIKRRKGICGNALWFDGFSTYISRKKEQFTPCTDAITISVWVAPHAFGGIEDERLTALVNQHNFKEKKGFILGFHKHGRLSFQLGLESGWVEVWANEQFLERNKWSHVAATYELESGLVSLYVNGVLAACETRKIEAFVPADEDLLIGKHNDPFIVADTFPLNMFSGLIDEVSIYRRALIEEEVAELYDSHLKPFNGIRPSIDYEDISIHRDDFAEDLHKPQYHLTPPGHWMNEPHAPFYFKGKYHLFYQCNPQGPYWGNIHWGHWVSDDLLHWKDLPHALFPEKNQVDPDGTWSGNAHYDQDGLPVLFFTAGNQQYLPNQMVALARSRYTKDGDLELKQWEKHSTPVIFQPEGSDLDDDGFRDPFIWKEGDTWFQLVGSGINGKGGTALLFESNNLLDWEYRGFLYVSDFEKHPYLGRVWELPILLPLGENSKGEEKHLFIISPVGEGADVEVFYWVGTWDKSAGRFIPDYEEPKLFDLGDFHFTGPSAMVDPETGKLILFTIAQGERPPEYEYAAGWAHNGGLPVEIFLGKDDQMRIKPIDQVKKLRKKKLLDLKEVRLGEANAQLKGISGDMLNISLTFKEANEGKYGLFIRQSNDHSEETLFYYDSTEEGFYVDRTKTTLDKKERVSGIQGGEVLLGGQPLQLQVFLDKSMVEAYVNEFISLTTRVYPTKEDAKGLSLFGDDHLVIESLQVWSMNGVY
jgi:sucrose-6-phosphate hydrolase SacC (GH32 family)